jgi:glycosyltransferase involved in cell wall biosynthesis
MSRPGLARLSALKSQGFEPALLCARSWPEGGALVAAPTKTTPFPIYTYGTTLKGKGAYYAYLGSVGRVIRRLRPDLIHFREEVYTIAAGQLLLERAISFKETPFVFESWQNIRKRYPWPSRWFESIGYKSADAAVAGAPGVEPVLRSGGFLKKIEMIPLGCIDPAVFTPNGPGMRETFPRKRLIGYAGRLVPPKGLDDLIKAVADLEVPSAVVIAGEGPERSRLETLAKKLAVEAVFVGAVGENAIPDFFRSLDVFVLPSRTTSRWKEQWGRVLVEAMGCGVPVIGSDSGEIPYVIGKHGIIFREGDVKALARSLNELLSDESLYAEKKRSAVERASSLTWTSHAALTAAFYRSVFQ